MFGAKLSKEDTNLILFLLEKELRYLSDELPNRIGISAIELNDKIVGYRKIWNYLSKYYQRIA
jgi:hypothetical protein